MRNFTKHTPLLIISTFLLIVSCDSVYATTKTASTGTWSTLTWSPAGVPGGSDDIVIPDAVTVTMDGDYTTSASLTLQGTGTIQMAAHNLTVGSLIAAGSAVINNAGATRTLTVGSDNTTTSYDGILTNNIQLTKTGTGSTELWGANSYSGGTTISNGRVLIDHTTGFGSGTVTINTGGIAWFWAPSALTVSNNFILSGSSGNTDYPTICHDGGAGLVTLNGTITLNGNSEIGVAGTSWNQMAINGVISGTGVLTIDEANTSALQTVTLNGANTFTGGTIITGGTLKLGNATALAGYALSLSGTAILDLNGYNNSITDITSSVNTATITDNSGSAGTTTLNVTAMNTTISCLIKDGSPRKIALRIVNFNAGFQLFPETNANTFSGGLTLANSPGWGTRMRVTAVITTVGSAGAITSSPYGTGTIYIGEAASDYAQILIDFNANNTIANAIVVNTKRGTDVAGSIRLDNGGHTLSGAITVNLDNLLINGNDAAASVTLSGQITGSHDVVLNALTGNLTVTLANAGTANSYSGATTIGANCKLVLGTSNQIPNTSAVSVSGTLDLNSYSETVGSITGAGTIDDVAGGGTSTLTCGGDNSTTTFSGTIQNTSGTLSITKTGSGTLTLSGGNNLTYDGATSVSAGILKLVDCNALANGSSPASFDISTGATLEFNANSQNISLGSTAVSGTVITGTGTLTKTGGWNLQLGNQGSSSNKVYINMTGGLIDIEAGSILNGGWQGGYWSNNKSSLYIASGAVIDLWDGNTIYVDALTGAGTVTKGSISASTNTIIIGVNNGSGTFTGTITETAGNPVAVTKQGSGTETFTGTNSYTGVTTISAGTLKLGSTSALGTTASATTITSGAVLDLNGQNYASTEALTINGTGIASAGAVINSSASTATFAGLITLGSASSIIAGSGDISISNTGTITGNTFNLTIGGAHNTTIASIIGTTSGSLIKSDAGVLTLSALNTFTGSTTVNGGTLKTTSLNADPGALGKSSGLTINTGATVLVATNGNSIFYINNPVPITINAGGTLTTENAIPCNIYGVITLNGGTLASGTPDAALGSWLLQNDISVTGNVTSTISATNINLLKSGGVTFTVADGTAASDLTISGTLWKSASLTETAFIKAGAGTVTLSGANTIDGGVTLNAGTININNATALGATTGTFTIANGTIIDNTSGGSISLTTNKAMTWNGDFTFTGSNALNLGTGTVTMGTSLRTITTSASTLTVGGTITGTGGLTKNGSGTMTLGAIAADNWTGPTTINGGTFNLGTQGSSDWYKSTSWTVNSGATLFQSSSNILTNFAVMTVNSGGTWNMNNNSDAVASIVGSGTISNIGGITLDLGIAGSVSDFSGIISGGGSITLRGNNYVGAGTQILSGLNTYTGPTTIQGDNLSINTIKDVAAGASSIGNPLTGNGTISIGSTTSTGTLIYTGTAQTTNRVINLAGTTGGAVLDQSGTGLLKFSNPFTATGTGAKILTLQGSTTGSGEIDGAIVDGATSTLTTLVKAGTGTWTLANPISYTGATSITGGSLVLQDQYTSPSFAISSGAILELNRTSDLDYTTNTSFTGAGTLKKTGAGKILWGTSTATFGFSSGALIDVEGGVFLGGSWGNEVWTNNYSDLNVESGAQFGGVEANVRVDALSGAGTISSGYSGSGYTNFTFGVDNGTGSFTGILTDDLAVGNFVKVGSGTQTLAGINTYTGTTTINGGTILLTGKINNSSTNTITVNNTGTLYFGTADVFGVHSATQLTPIVINAGGIVTCGSNINALGPLTLNGGTLTSTGGCCSWWPSWALKGTVLVTASSTISASGTWSGIQLGDGTASTGTTFDVASGATLLITSPIIDGRDDSYVPQASYLTKTNTGTLTLTGSNSYTGAITVSAGILQLGATGDATNTPLGAAGAGISVSSGAVLDLAGYTLGISKALTLNGSGISNGGALINSGGSASYSGNITLASASTITADNQITLSGTISNNQDLTKAGTASLVFTNNTVSVHNLALTAGTLAAGASTINVTGNFTNSATFTANTSTVNFLGSSAQVIPAVTFNNMTVNNATGASLAGNIAINGTVTLTSGILTTGAFAIDLGVSGSIVEATPTVTAPTSYVTGTVKATRSLMQNVNNTFGGLGIELTDANLDNNSTLVTRVTGTACIGNFGTKTGIKRYFTITPTTDAGLNGTMVFHYFDNEITGHTEANIKIYKSIDNRSHWTVQNSSIDVANNKATLTGISTFSDWTASDAVNQSLPITLTDFTAHAKNKTVMINWQTATEINNDFFTLEHSINGEQWNIIFSCEGAGTSTNEHYYSYIDYNPSEGINYYRLKQTDIDGAFTYSPIESVELNNNNVDFMVYPNPGKLEAITIMIKSLSTDNATLSIIDATGRQICSGVIEQTTMNVSIRLSDICTINPGTYFISICTKDMVVRKKIVVE